MDHSGKIASVFYIPSSGQTIQQHRHSIKKQKQPGTGGNRHEIPIARKTGLWTQADLLPMTGVEHELPGFVES